MAALLSRLRREPLLSVVVPAYRVERDLDACLTSVREQDYRRVEVVVVDDGSDDGSLAIAEAHAAADRRVRVVRRPNGGLSAARNTGVEAATGDFLTFVDADDVVTPDGLRAAMDSLARTGSDVAVLRYGRLRGGRPAQPAAWIRDLHRRDRPGVTLDELPDVLVNATAWGKVFRRDFYDRAGLRFVEGVIYEDQAFTAEAYAKARAIDVLATTGYLWRVNETSLSQGQVTAANLLGRLRAAEDSLAVLAGHPQARAQRALHQLRYNLANSALKLERADDEYADVFAAHLPAILAAAPPQEYAATVPAELRVVYALVCEGPREALWRFVQAEGMQPQVHPSGPEPAGWTLYLPGWGSDPVPPETYVATQAQLRPAVRVRSARREGPDVVVDLAAWVPTVDLTVWEPTLTASVQGRPAAVTHDGEPHVVSSRQGAERRHLGAGWTVRVEDAPPGRFELAVELAAGPAQASTRVKVDA